MPMKKAALATCWILALFGGCPQASGQANRQLDRNSIGWYVYNGDHKLSRKWELHTEYQWRRIDLIKTWQQSLARLGAAYKLTDKVKIGAGYTYFVTFPYGQYPVADRGVPITEHRTHQDVQWQDTSGRLQLSHRIRLEQRWLGQPAENNPRRVAAWEFQNRIRYQLQAEFPLSGTTIGDGEFYLTFFDEVFLGFGKNVANNIFNQNRIFGGLGYQVKEGFQLELGYLNQLTQHAENDALTGKPVFEVNNGFRLTVNHSLDFVKR